MYESSQSEPTLPANMSVFLAAHAGLRQGQYQHRLLADAETQKPELFIGTITIKHMVVQVLEDIVNDGEIKTFQHDYRVGGYEARIWPFSEPFKWPPRRALTDLGLEVFGGPQPGEAAPKRKGLCADCSRGACISKGQDDTSHRHQSFSESAKTSAIHGFSRTR